MTLELIEGDITVQHVDVMVNAANSSLLGGGGVDGAIHRKGWPRILAECRALRASQYGRGLRTGEAVATTAGDLPAGWVVHTVGPVWSPAEDRSALLRSSSLDARRTRLLQGCDLQPRDSALFSIIEAELSECRTRLHQRLVSSLPDRGERG
ncbi:macro domain-containing protein [Allorhizocola rhizosphaerae]|uniref:macro domain-containing protein n=1 Tax=Allorhizocola rhizosphaerae TaxID=1872709 RepID=UPI000E3CBA2F|nr:macro domain-containing protein [Allorhizocola rhizosphaerae]